jgi:nitrogen-specific signal transduction histidine kinase
MSKQLASELNLATPDSINPMLVLSKDKESLISQLAVTLNHEINNPLTGIVGSIELAIMNTNNEDLKELLKTAIQNAMRIKEVTNKVQKIKRVISKKYVGNTMMLDLEESTK